eukprot:2207341-Pleurochrysis_carterae.AAC.1
MVSRLLRCVPLRDEARVCVVARDEPGDHVSRVAEACRVGHLHEGRLVARRLRPTSTAEQLRPRTHTRAHMRTRAHAHTRTPGSTY